MPTQYQIKDLRELYHVLYETHTSNILLIILHSKGAAFYHTYQRCFKPVSGMFGEVSLQFLLFTAFVYCVNVLA